MLIISKVSASAMNPSSLIWSSLIRDKEHGPLKKSHVDINIAFIAYWNYWSEDDSDWPNIPKRFRLLCNICAKMRIPTSDGKQLVDIMREYTTQLMANYDDEDDENHVLLRYKAKTIMELLTAHD